MKALVFTKEQRGKTLDKRMPAVATAAVAASVLFLSCTPMAEPVKKGTTPAEPEKVIQLEEEPIDVTGGEAAAPVQEKKAASKQGYDSSTNPFSLDATPFDELYKEGKGLFLLSPQGRVEKIFSKFHVSGTAGVKATKMAGKAPRTASEAVMEGGDCTDLNNIAIALLDKLNVPGGALVIHFKGDKESLNHMVAYVELDGKRVIVDLQAAELGQTFQGKYDVILTLTYDQAAYMYHREYGDYLRDKGKSDEAITAYERALELFEGDAYVHQNLGMLYGRRGDIAKASQHLDRAAELDPRFATDKKIGDYNEEIDEGQRAYDESRWADCVTHLKNALKAAKDAGMKLSKGDRDNIQAHIDACASQQ